MYSFRLLQNINAEVEAVIVYYEHEGYPCQVWNGYELHEHKN